MACAVVLIGGRTSDKKEQLKKMGFRWHSVRRNWFKYGEPSDVDRFHRQAKRFWAKHPGEILFKTFVAEDKVDNGIPF